MAAGCWGDTGAVAHARMRDLPTTVGHRGGPATRRLGRRHEGLLGAAGPVPAVLALQAAAGNRAVAAALGTVVQRACACGGTCPSCAAADVGVLAPLAVLQRQGGTADDLSGSPFAAFDPALKAKLAEPGVFDRGGAATLAAALDRLPNAAVAAISRVGAMISATAPFLWQYVAKIHGGWITDNFGMGVAWTDGAALASVLAADAGWCRDNPATARWYHGSTAAYRQIPARPGAASLHVITAGSTDVHIDVHQPVEGKETSWPWRGQCNIDWSAWASHAADVSGGGARGTAVGRYAVARGRIEELRSSAEATDAQRRRLDAAAAHLDAIAGKVQKYAAVGNMAGDEWEGDRQMAADRPVMAELEAAEAIVREVAAEQAVERMERGNRHRKL